MKKNVLFRIAAFIAVCALLFIFIYLPQQKKLKELERTFNQIGNLDITDNLSQSDRNNVEKPLTDEAWFGLDGQMYKGELIEGLGQVWLRTNANNVVSFIKAGIIGNISDIGGKIKVIDNGTDVFSCYVNNKFESNFTILTDVTSSISNENYASLKYEILGTSSLDFDIERLTALANSYYPRFFGNNNVTGVFFADGFFIRKLTLKTFSKLKGGATLATPVLKIDGSLFGESGTEDNRWYVSVHLTDLSFFYQDTVVNGRNLSRYDLLKSVLQNRLTPVQYLEVAHDPKVLRNGYFRKKSIPVTTNQQRAINEIVSRF